MMLSSHGLDSDDGYGVARQTETLSSAMVGELPFGESQLAAISGSSPAEILTSRMAGLRVQRT
jgi:hypothetical protein